MLFRRETLAGIRDGSVTLAFRRWRRPTVREGGTLLTAGGELQIGAVRTIALGSITVADARKAGYETRQALVEELTRRDAGEFYRIELGALGPDPRTALRETPATEEELETLRKRLARLDTHAEAGPWTERVLKILDKNSGVRAGDLCRQVDQEKDQFKRNVRKLKNLGLTESLGTGYRLSPRGSALLKELER